MQNTMYTLLKGVIIEACPENAVSDTVLLILLMSSLFLNYADYDGSTVVV